MDAFDLLLQDLKTLFEVRVFVNGKVDMQKTLYFMKELGYRVPFDFRWSKLGPYSYELASIIERMTFQGYLEYSGRYEIVEKSFRFVKPNDTSKMKKFFLEMEKIWNKNSFNQVDFIECAASLHFIYKSSTDKRRSEVFKKLAFLKPDRMSAFEPLKEESWNFLARQDLLQ
jgi:uncharacterized protein YwgA